MYSNTESQSNDNLASAVDVPTAVDRSNTINRLFLPLVIVPIMLAMTAIFSTLLPTELQSQLVMGLPLILWVWFAIALFLCLLSVVISYKVINQLSKTSQDKTAQA